MKEKERRLKDVRTLEAQKKKYMGLEGKLGVICKSMGDEIIQEIDGGGWFDSTEFDDPYALPDDTDTGNRRKWGQRQLPLYAKHGLFPVYATPVYTFKGIRR